MLPIMLPKVSHAYASFSYQENAIPSLTYLYSLMQCHTTDATLSTNHVKPGLGIYSNFRDHDVNVATAIIIPERIGVTMKNMFTVKLDNIGKISSILNGRGPGPTPDMERGTPLKCLNSSCTINRVNND